MTTQGDNSSELINLNQESTGAGEEPGKPASWEPPKPHRRHIGIKPYHPKDADTGLESDSFSEDEEIHPRRLKKALKIDLWSRKMISLQYEQEYARRTRWLRWLFIAFIIGLILWDFPGLSGVFRDERGRWSPWTLPILVGFFVWMVIDFRGSLNDPDWHANKTAIWWIILCLSLILFLLWMAMFSNR